MVRRIIAVTCVAIAVGIVWLLFGWQTVELPFGDATTRRWFGRNLITSLDKDRDGNADAVSRYTWRHPYEGLLEGPCVYPGVKHVEDRDGDGRWDTWTEDRCDRPNLERYLLRADTTGDGHIDTEIATNDGHSAYKKIEEARGF